MSKSEKKKSSKHFSPGGDKPSQAGEELPKLYADEEGVETTNIMAGGGGGGVVDGYSAADSTEEYTFKGVTPGKTYLHPPKRLVSGRVIYRAKFYGHMNVKEPRGSAMVKDAIDKLTAVAAVFKANNRGEDLKSVDLSFSIRGITCTDVEKGEILHQHPIHSVSFSADDKRGKMGNMFAYIAKGRPPMRENICYVFEVKAKQARELTATVGQAFELAYKKYLEAKKAREGFEQLKQIYHTASESEKEKIRVQLEEGRKQRAKEIAAAKEKSLRTTVDPKYRPSHNNSAPVSVPESTSDAVSWMKEDEELAKQVAGVQKKASEIELDSKLQGQKKELPRQSSVITKWDNITTALEPFQIEPSLDPNTQYLVPRLETSELDDAIAALTGQIEDLEEAFSWRSKRGLGPLDEVDGSHISSEPFSHPLLDGIDDKLREIEATTEDLEIPELPANYVMDEFIKAREKAHLPKEGTVKDAASGWYKAHYD